MTLELQLSTAQGGRRSVPVRRLSAGGGRLPAGRIAEADLEQLDFVESRAGLAAGCGALTAPELAQERLDALFRVAGVA